MSKIYLDLLDENRQKLFSRLAVFRKFGYLGGGTALALQINHRKSFDFDIFVEKPIRNALHLAVTHEFGPQTLDVNSEDQMTFSPQQSTEVAFLWYYWKPIAPLVETSSLSLASIIDIAADKAHTLGRRAAWRDCVDVFILIKEHAMSIQAIIDAATKKFQGEFVVSQFLEQLSYFGDTEITPVEFIGAAYTPEEIKLFLEKEVKRYVSKILPI